MIKPNFNAGIAKLSDKADTIFAAFAGIGWYLWLSTVGIAISPDSSEYLFFSLQIHYKGDYSGIYTVWPPAYPFLLSVAQFINIAPADAATLISAVSLLLLLLCLSFVMKLINIPVAIRCFGLFFLILNSDFLHVFEYAWADGPFTAFYILFIAAMLKHWQTEKFLYFILAATAVSLMSLTKYIGYFSYGILAAYLLAFLFYKKNVSPPLVTKYLVIFVITPLPSIVWAIRNHQIDGTIHGPRTPARVGLLQNIEYLLDVTYRDNISLIIMILVVFGILAVLVHKNHINNTQIKQERSSVFLILFSAFGYLCLLLYGVSTVDLEQLYTRYISPIYPIILLIFIYQLSLVLRFVTNKSTGPNSRRTIAIFTTLLVFVGTAYTLRQETRPYLVRPFHIHKFTDFKFLPGDLGFQFSREKTAISKYLESYLAGTDDLNVYVFINQRPGIVEPYLNRSVFFRNGVFSNLTLIGFEPDRTGYDVLLTDRAGQLKRVRYLHAASPLDLRKVDMWPASTVAILDHENFELVKDDLKLQRCSFERIQYLYGVTCPMKT
jgi:hypothetical protein